MNTATLLDPARQSGESRNQYVRRRAAGNRFVRQARKGRMAWVAVRIIEIPNPFLELAKSPGERAALPETIQSRQVVQGTYRR